MRERWARALGVAALVAAPAVARAQAPPPAERSQVYSAYELETIAEVVDSLHASLDPAPEGKTIERIDVVPIDVFEKRDPLPRWLNVFHATTREAVVRDEVLLHVGGPYAQVLADDTLRNLRHLIQLSVVLVVAARGTRPDAVRVVVITKDVWSLRLNWDVAVDAGGLEQFIAQPSEWNVAGVHHVGSGLFIIDPATVTLGAGYEIPRVVGSRVSVAAGADVVANRQSGALEGSGAELVAGQPIYSGLTDWSWDATVAYADGITRVFQNAAQRLYLDPATGVKVPIAYHARTYASLYEATRSFGWDVKHDVTVGADVNDSSFRPAFSADGRTTADFASAYLPSSDARAGPFVQYHSYTKRYVRLIDFETLILQEDASLGHDLVLRAAPSFRALGASYDVVALYAAAQYSWSLSDGFFRVGFASTTEPQPDHVGNAAVSPSARLVTPTVLGIGRLVADGTLLARWRDELNVRGACAGFSRYAPFAQCASFLGGSNRLRGYPTNFFVGKDFVAYNVEPPYFPVRRARPSRALPLARPRCLLSGHRLSARATDRSVDGRRRAPARFLRVVRAGIRHAERRGAVTPSDRAGRMVSG